jgi:hypothetical protein
MISTADLSRLPDIATLRRLTQALATLDAVLSPEWESRYYSFNAGWSAGEQMASMRDGQGDHWFALFCPAGVALLGLAHEAPSYRMDAPQPWVFDQLPAEFHANTLNEPAFDTGNATFCIWRLAGEGWRCGRRDAEQPDDGSAELLDILAGDPAQYVEFAARYYEIELRLEDVAALYRHEPLTPEFVARLNPEIDYAALRDDLREIGYPERA